MWNAVKLWLRHSNLVCAFAGDPVVTIEDWSQRCAKITTPDQIIAQAIMQSMAKDFEDWVVLTKEKVSHGYYDSAEVTRQINERRAEIDKAWYATHSTVGSTANFFTLNVVLENKKKRLKVAYRKSGETRDTFYVNGISFPDDLGCRIQQTYSFVEGKRETAKAVAAKAKAEMERNEAAWNLAENLLGMKRNEHGALVPVKSPLNECDDCETIGAPCERHD